MKPHSTVTKRFRKLSREEKFKSVLSMCKLLGTIPKTYSTKSHTPSESERVRGQFFINMQSAMNRNKLPQMYHHYIEKISEYGNRFEVGEKIDLVYEFYTANNRLPTHKDDDVTLMNQWKSIKSVDPTDPTNELSKRQQTRLSKMIDFATQLTPVSKIDKMKNLLAFCSEHGRTPKQHSENLAEKKLADFLSTLKQSIKKKPLPEELNVVYQEIIKFAPQPRVPNR